MAEKPPKNQHKPEGEKPADNDAPGTHDHSATANVPAVQSAATNTPNVLNRQNRELVIPGGLIVEMVKSVTRPVLRQIPRTGYFVQVESGVYTGKELSGLTKEGEPKEKPADLIDVINLETGEEMVLIANSVLKSELDRAYPSNGFVGKCFAIMSFEPDGERKKRYRTYSIKEISVKGRAPSIVADVTKPPVHSAAGASA